MQRNIRRPRAKIHFLTISRFRPRATAKKITINLHTICTEANIEKLNALLPALKTCIDKEEQALNLPRGKEFMEEIRELDAARDESYRALQFTVRAAKYRRAADV